MIKSILKKAINQYKNWNISNISNKNIKTYLASDRIPWSVGYTDFKRESIKKVISDPELQVSFIRNKLLPNFGYRLDERIVEYGWLFSNLIKGKTTFLDAGSTFNFEYMIEHSVMKEKDIYIYTYYPEEQSYVANRISYNFGDLRDLPYKDNLFDEIVCQSTLEHIDMDNSMYGYDLKSNLNVELNKSYEYIKVIEELLRVLKNNGQLLLTFPFGKFENHGFFQQFDSEMLGKIIDKIKDFGNYEYCFFKYLPEGWIIASQENCSDSESFNPHTQIGKKEDFAAHSRAICCIKFIKAK
uniref:methyltransferase domain-containing protein n=1 Tax=Algoriphagus sp. TaxID=1872435 RepID=UPI004047EE5B